MALPFLFDNCTDPMYQEDMGEATCDTFYIPAALQYNIPNNDREKFGGSPEKWAAGIKTDSGTFLFTEAELKFFKKRSERNLTDTIK